MAVLTLVDTSVLVAASVSRETMHAQAAQAIRDAGSGTLGIPVSILAETMSFVRARYGSHHQRTLWDAIAGSGMEVLPADCDLVVAARRIDSGYSDAEFGFADCMLLATCERERAARVLSFDRRLAAYRPSFAPALEVLP